MAVEHAEHVARLQHVLQQATEKARKAGGRPACITATIFMEVEVPDSHEARLAPPPLPLDRPPWTAPAPAPARSVHSPLGCEGHGHGHVVPSTGRRRRFWRGYR